jgi:hypothetical protein
VTKAGYALALLALLPVTASAEKSRACNVDEQQLLGYWKGNGPFEEMHFTNEDGVNIFNSWLHQRPDHLNAVWSVSQCKLKIGPRGDGDSSYEFTIRLSGKSLYLADAVDKSTARYRRLPDPE